MLELWCRTAGQPSASTTPPRAKVAHGGGEIATSDQAAAHLGRHVITHSYWGLESHLVHAVSHVGAAAPQVVHGGTVTIALSLSLTPLPTWLLEETLWVEEDLEAVTPPW